MRDTRSSTAVRFFVLLVFAIVMVFPYWYMVVVSLRPFQYSLQYPPELLPVHPSLANYVMAWQTNNFSGYFLRSLYVSVVSTVLGTLIACAAAFVVSRYRFVGRRVIYYVFLGSMMIPSMTFILPQFKLMKALGLLNSLAGLILIYTSGMIPFTTFLMKGFFDDIPLELEEALLMDGGGKWALFTRVMLPMAVPSLVTAVLFNFMGGWDEFTQALTFLQNPNKFTLPIALMLFQGQHSTDWGQFFAAAVIQTLPIIVMFIVFQRHIVKGIMAGAVKG
ncbi:MAG: carbohydrate ABC transporter permease [Alicyclobacillus sp.]|nr:carbohydrate ABC transporter permease [Alicyclobacillus sp.]